MAPSGFGAACGAIALTLLHQGLVVFEDYEMLIHGALLMAMMIFMPQGLFVGLSQGARQLLANQQGLLWKPRSK